MDDGVLRKLHFTILKIWICILQFVLLFLEKYKSVSNIYQTYLLWDVKDFTFIYIWYINYNEYVPGAREEGSHYHWFVVIITSSSSSLSAAEGFSSSFWWLKYKFWNLCWKNWMKEKKENLPFQLACNFQFHKWLLF